MPYYKLRSHNHKNDYGIFHNGTEAAELLIEYGFNSLNLHRIESAAYVFNKQGVALHKKLGFTEERISRKAIYKNSKYHNIVNFSFLKKEYKMLNK